MIGAHPTMGCLLFVQDTTIPLAEKQLIQALHPVIPPDRWQTLENGTLSAWISIGKSRLETIMHSHKTHEIIYIFLEFDEEQVVQTSRTTGLTLSEIISVVVVFIQVMPEVYAIGVGFELSSPVIFEDQALRDAGVSTIYLRSVEDENWIRNDILPMKGHYLFG